ncbi:MAG: septal ring lytic transglycosylase RlpA family protein [Ghiorsea sp.]|nr:septal ring lytic transglycosylase RlpA family protein [Ghiorsea sp.]
MNINIYLILALLVLNACAPTRYAHQSGKAAPSQTHASSYATVGSGGSVKHGKPYKVAGKWYYPLASNVAYNQVGIASWYGKKFHGRKTANGETYNMYAMTAAHTILPMPSLVLVTNLENGKSVKVKVNDRGPFAKGRLIDLSYAAAKALGYVHKGTARVRVQTLNARQHRVSQSSAGGEYNRDVAYVQVGAFSQYSNARKVVAKLQRHLNASDPALSILNVGHVYRVRVGPFDSDADAAQRLRSIQRQGYAAAMIIHEKEER